MVRNREVEFASDDHKPTNDGEKRRIENAGGRVMIQRINGSLAVSRALGKPTAAFGNLSTKNRLTDRLLFLFFKHRFFWTGFFQGLYSDRIS